MIFKKVLRYPKPCYIYRAIGRSRPRRRGRRSLADKWASCRGSTPDTDETTPIGGSYHLSGHRAHPRLLCYFPSCPTRVTGCFSWRSGVLVPCRSPPIPPYRSGIHPTTAPKLSLFGPLHPIASAQDILPRHGTHRACSSCTLASHHHASPPSCGHVFLSFFLLVIIFSSEFNKLITIGTSSLLCRPLFCFTS